MKTIINYKNRLIRVRNCLLIILFFLSAVIIHAQTTTDTQTVYSPVSLPSNDILMEDMVVLDYESLFYLDRDIEQGIKGIINSEGGRIDVKVYAYDADRTNGRGIEIYSTYITESSPDSSYVKGHITRKNVLEGYDPSSGTLGSGYVASPFIVDSNDIKRRAQDAIVNNAPIECQGESSWTNLFLPDNSCIEDHVDEIQPVIVEITRTGDVVFKGAKVPGIGVLTEIKDRIIRGISDSQNGFDYCKSREYWYTRDSDFCRRHHYMRRPNTSKEDIVIVANKGWWGYDLGSGPPENTKDAVNKSNGERIRFIEIDLASSSDGKLFAIDDYIMERLTNYTGNKNNFIFRLHSSVIQTLKLKKRNGDLSDHSLSKFHEVLDEAVHHGIIMIVNFKEEISDVSYNKRNWATMVKSAIREAQKRPSTQNLVFKTYFTYEEVKRLVGRDLMNTVLWAPIIVSNNFKNDQGTPDISLIVDFINGWNINTTVKNLVAYFGTYFIKPSDVMLQSFSTRHEDLGMLDYENLLHYIYNETDRRSGIFSEDPEGFKGNVDSWGNWKIKDPNKDIRGDFFKLIDIPYGKTMIISTDRLDVWKEIKNIY